MEETYPEIRYSGTRSNNGMGSQRIYKQFMPDGEVTELTPDYSFTFRNHSPDGFNWGYSGSGPAQTALAILLDATSDPEEARANYQDFKVRYVAAWQDNWFICRSVILLWLKANKLSYLQSSLN